MKFERLFKISSYGLFASGFTALATTGAVELTGVVLYGLVLLSSWWWEERRSLLPLRVQNLLILAYLGFYLVDLVYVSRPVLATVHLVFFVSAIKLFSQKEPRDYLFLDLFSLAQLLIASTFTINILFVVEVFVFALFGIACLLLHEVFAARRSFRSEVVASDSFWGAGSFFVHVTSMTVVLCLLSVPFFLVLPRLPGNFLRGVPRGATLSGFSDHVQLGDIGRIKLNSAVVMRVKVNRPLAEIPASLKWRGLSLAHFDGSGWTRGVEGYSVRPNASGGYRVAVERYRSGDLLQQIFVTQPGTPAVLFHAPRLISVSNEVQGLVMDAAGNFFYRKPRYSGGKYTLFSSLGGDPPGQSAGGWLQPALAGRYLLLPEMDPRIGRLARQVTAQERDALEKARSLERFLKSNYSYSLDINMPRGVDPLPYFLFDVRAGHCEFFASAQAVMLRALGIPARVVNGFRRGEFNRWGRDFIVRQSDAHSWVEAYFPGTGWVEFDPTPPEPESASPAWMATLGHLFDAVDLFWTTEIVSYDFWKQMSFFRSFRQQLASLFQSVDRQVRYWNRARQNEWPLVKFVLKSMSGAGILLLALAAAFGLLYRFRIALFAALARALPPARSGPVRTLVASQCYLRFLRKLAARGICKNRGETAWELVARIDAEDLRASAAKFADLYYRFRYGPATDISTHQLMALLEEL
ncbi:MAG: DUF3488 domain-containing protein [Acidobacteria bacterium]|nr:DUF3488 domain-containing protein [Acidobacteriota bacterium]